MLLSFVFVSLEGSSGDVGALHEEASNEQRIGRNPKKEADGGDYDHFVMQDERKVS